MKCIIPCVAWALALVVGPVGSQSPYRGQELRTIKAVSPDEVRGYLNGEGLGYAKAGELNHFPGPHHALVLGFKLGLRGDQRSQLVKIYNDMHERAVPLGEQIVAAEAKLDSRFASGTIAADQLAPATANIASLQGRLRAVHLAAHIATKRVLSTSQIAKYDDLRGYGRTNAGEGHQHRH